jgi:DNA-binding NarL/FixJ family response regulator
MQDNLRRLIVVEDEPLVQNLLVHELSRAGFEVRAADSAASARRLIDEFDPDVMLLDVDLGAGPTGIHLAHALATTRPDIAVLILTKYPDARSATADGLELPENVGFLRKHLVSDSQYLLTALEKVLADKAEEVRQDTGIPSALSHLSDKLFTVLKLIADGYVNAEIASRTGTSQKTVERHIDQLYAALNIETRGELNPRVAAAKLYYSEVGLGPRK